MYIRTYVVHDLNYIACCGTKRMCKKNLKFRLRKFLISFFVPFIKRTKCYFKYFSISCSITVLILDYVALFVLIESENWEGFFLFLYSQFSLEQCYLRLFFIHLVEMIFAPFLILMLLFVKMREYFVCHNVFIFGIKCCKTLREIIQKRLWRGGMFTCAILYFITKWQKETSAR